MATQLQDWHGISGLRMHNPISGLHKNVFTLDGHTHILRGNFLPLYPYLFTFVFSQDVTSPAKSSYRKFLSVEIPTAQLCGTDGLAFPPKVTLLLSKAKSAS